VITQEKLSASNYRLVYATRYHQLIGSLMYMVNTRSNICFSMNTLSQYMVDPRSVHWIGEKHVLRYIVGSMDYGLDHIRGDGVRLIGYTYLDWVGCAVDRKITSGCCFGFGSTVVSWLSWKSMSVALSYVETECMAASQASCEVIWLHKVFFGLFGHELRPTIIHCNNQSFIKLSKNIVFHDRSKHIEIGYDFIQDWVHIGEVHLEYIPTDEHIEKIFMKSFPKGKHVYFGDKMVVVKNIFLDKREC
jgi:hypothetical protein